MSMKRMDWTFASYIEEIVMLSEIIEIPGMKAKRDELIREVWGKYPNECEALGLRDGVQK
jgi:hypothetical protein